MKRVIVASIFAFVLLVAFGLVPYGEMAVNSDLKGLRVLSAFLISLGKYEEATTYFRKFLTSFFDIQGYSYEFSTWPTIEEAVESIGEKVPDQ